ncbi:MAG: hypothetical protein ACLVJK_08415 [Alistipes putredinis]
MKHKLVIAMTAATLFLVEVRAAATYGTGNARAHRYRKNSEYL